MASKVDPVTLYQSLKELLRFGEHLASDASKKDTQETAFLLWFS